MRILILLIAFVLVQPALKGQCSLLPCAEDDCGGGFVNYTTTGESNVFCVGESILLINESTVGLFDEFMIDWGDGEIDTTNTYDDLSHTYSFNDLDPCEDGPSITVQFCYIGIANCAEGQSCNWASSVLTVEFPPVANFDIEQEVCQSTPVDFNNTSCNGEEYFWEFGDGETSTLENPSYMYASPGDYAVTLTVTNGCGTDQDVRTISLVAPPEATIQAEVNPETGCEPVVLELNSQSNGYTNLEWNISPFNDSLYCVKMQSPWCIEDTLTSLTDNNLEVLFDTPGTYTITITGSNVCGDVEDEFTLEVLESPIFSLIAPPIECDAATFTPEDFNFLYEGSIDDFNWTFSGGDPATATGPDFGSVTFSNSGTVTLEIESPCGDMSETIDISIATTAAININNPPTTLCQNGDPIQLSATPTGGVWENLTDGILDPSMFPIGLQTFTYVVGGVECPNEQSIQVEILESPEISLTTPDLSCDEAIISSSDIGFSFGGTLSDFDWTFVGGNPASAAGSSFSGVEFANSGMVILEASGACGTLFDTVDINIATTQAISLAGNPTSLCQNDAPVDLVSSPTNGVWEELAGTTLNPADYTPGNYTFTYSAGSAECPNSESIMITILEGIDVELAAADPACDELDYIPVVDFSGEIDMYSWAFTNGSPAISSGENPGTIIFNTPGIHPVVVSVAGVCGMVSDTIAIEIQANVDLVIEPVDDPLCAGSSPDTLVVNSTGGTWSGDGIIDANNGIFDPASVAPDNNYTLTYSIINGACSASESTTVEVVSSQIVTVNDEILCVDSEPLDLTADAAGGEWSGTGIINAEAGTFDPLESGEGEFFPNYTFIDLNGCEVIASPSILVEPYPVLTFPDTIELCLTDEDIILADVFAYLASPADGTTTWQGEGVIDADAGIFNSGQSGLGAGLYNISVTYARNVCVQTLPAYINVVESPILALDPDQAVCISDGTLQLNANLDGGVWSGTAIDQQGLVDLNAIGDGFFTYGYLYEEGTSCEQQESTTIEVIDLSQIVEAGAEVELCENEVAQYTFTGQAPAGGTWEGAAISDASLGTIDVTQLVLDSLYTYNYCIESESVAGCSACASRTLIVHSNPVAQFSFDGTPCIGETFTMINESEGAVIYAWDFGDSSTSGLMNPTHVYNNQATYTLSLQVISAESCEDIATQELYITTPPTVAFDLTEEEGCAPFLVEVENNSFGDGITQYWLIAGDTIFSTQPDAIYLDSVTMDSTFAIELVVSNLCGEVNQVDSVLVHPYPIVNFDSNIDEGCSPLTVTFGNTTLGDADTYFWDLGNGVTSTDSIPPTQTYTTNDSTFTIYDILLVATNECGVDSLWEDVTVFSPDVRAFIALDTLSGCQPFEIQLESFSTPGANVSWELTDEQGNTYSSNETNPVFVLQEPGIHTIVLAASGCGTDFDTAYVEVFPAPLVSFTHRPYICVGQEIFFQNGSIDVSLSEWDFGDGQTITADNPGHIYDTAGVYTVTLTAYSDLNNCPATFSSEILVVDNPIADFTLSELNGCSPLVIDFNNESEGLGVLNYHWQFSDGSSASFEESPTHTFFDPGTYPVQLIVFDQDSCFADTAIYNIFVFSDPVSDFSFVEQDYCHRYDTVTLVNESTNAVSFVWELPDLTFTEVEGQWLPSEAGTQELTLIAESSNGCLDTTSQIIDILPSPLADFAISTDNGCEDLLVTLENQSTGLESFFWDLGDNTTSTDAVFNHYYTEAGTYDMMLVANHSNGCPTDTAMATIEVHPKPIANFSFDESIVCGSPQTIEFTNTSIGSQDNNWSFGNIGTSNLTSPSFTFTEIGLYEIELLVQNEYDCKDTLTQTLNIYGNPLANFLIETPEGCEDLFVVIENLSTEALNYIWEVEGQENVNINDINQEYLFTEPGSYDVQLIAVYNDFCQDTLSIIDAINVYQSPIADFTYVADESENIIGDVRFINNSQFADRYFWDLGDGTTTVAFEPVHEYDINRSVDALLIAYNDNGGEYICIDSLVMPIEPEWITTYFVPNAFAPEYGEGDVRVFKPQGIGIEEYEITVYSPWGEQVWYSEALEDKRPTGSWDGIHQGQLVPQGAYAYLARVVFVDGTRKTYRGTVNVLR